MQCILIIFPLPQLLPDPSTSLPNQLYLCPSLSQNNKTNKQIKTHKISKRQKKKRPKLNNIYKRNKQKTRNLYMLAPGHRACPGVWLIHPGTLE